MKTLLLALLIFSPQAIITLYILTKLNLMSKKIELSDETLQSIIKAVGADNKPAPKRNGMEYVICRTYSAGVFAGYLEKEEGQEVTLRDARRIWYWEGAASLSQLATDGTSNPNACKFPCEVDTVRLKNAIEIIPCTQKAQDSINSVKVWQQ